MEIGCGNLVSSPSLKSLYTEDVFPNVADINFVSISTGTNAVEI